ncbi:lysozyme inhibitor LprI family protein [Lacibacterium aquatile]|uniref:Lysozyme inhibitor LprI family protein n=1 Tax=Lacibacterium aquatile TaxID=1168082 RepID=A0ABW5DTE6_9PROT
MTLAQIEEPVAAIVRRNSQRIWLQHREASCNLYMEIFDGTAGRLQANSCSLQMLAERTLEIEDFILE